MGDFSESDVTVLYQQHSDETGQPFTPQALARIWHWTQGQPWLVNAIGYEVTFRRKDLRDRTRTIDAEAIDQATEPSTFTVSGAWEPDEKWHDKESDYKDLADWLIAKGRLTEA